jgi:hypothetical protein
MLDELKQLQSETQEIIDGLAAEMQKADENAGALDRLELEISDSDAEFQLAIDEIEGEIDALS